LVDAPASIWCWWDSLAQTMLGYENTLSVTMDEMLHHVKACGAD
jgi:ketopantoate hydroxymethyltransferase